MIQKNNIKTILSSKIDIPEHFVVGKISSRPNDIGCVEINGDWYIYNIDDRGGCICTGPFNDRAIIYACALEMDVESQFSDYKFSAEEADTYMDSHFRYEE